MLDETFGQIQVYKKIFLKILKNTEKNSNKHHCKSNISFASLKI